MYVTLSAVKEQILLSAILPKLPIVGYLKLTTADLKTIQMIEVVDDEDSEGWDSYPLFSNSYKDLELYLTAQTQKLDLPLDDSRLTDFQKKVYKVMKSIPYGKTMTYGEIAQKMNSKAFQAIGTACGKNPFLLTYPCHRVLGTNNLGGFAHGLEMKQDLLLLEKAISFSCP